MVVNELSNIKEMNIKGKITAILLLSFMMGCTLESEFSLPNDEEIKTELIGEWRRFNEEDHNETFRIEKNDDKTYTLTLNIFEEEKITAFSKKIKEFDIMNVVAKEEGKVKNLFYGFRVDNNTLTYSEVNDALIANDFKSQTELLNFFRENISKKEFFVNPVILKRK